ncbi:hypothetical protein VOLCADRAFT_83978 [Volvox carteri f. nagariensis]|uniref:Rab-GAP TBC domain-containing protein n=1 Tax=Volvox carteri f. nagariensis TaxID=3068 RepID=D8UEZ0_VOLCA|nr:uncharacterized protein VOLCADRAFT_83978 [Volvox carteri f. nagariensis]EFJ41677.1 hypothetical protein VOLCADRAFT_83978 [Volvox carteri f. nagariensis]|eukprot:XP_002957179.1 hypothetical protein VOLCADRAFT_83978 [Volvox carteri f. nagariensis]
MEYAKGLLNRAKELAVQTAQEIQGQRNVAQETREPPSTVLSPSASLSSPTVQTIEARIGRFKTELRGSRINLDNLKRLAFNGIPDSGNLRATVWKLLLGYLPLTPEDWSKELAKKRTTYHVFCEVGRSLKHVKARCVATASAGGGYIEWKEPVEDHPLCLSQTSKWNTYFKDSEIMVQVERDVLRTHPDMHFFTGDTPDAEAHREDMKRALFMYAKLNPGLRYIQGMNELIAPLYYLFRNDTQDLHAAKYAEADAFWCFMELISDFRDHFCQQLDNASTGIKATIRRLMLVLQYYDRELWHHMEVVHKVGVWVARVDPQFYAFRWLTLLLSQEFAFPDTLRIWDTILSDPHGRMDCLLRICVAMILNVGSILRNGDFTVILKTLQRYPPVDVNVLLQRAAEMPPCSVVLGARV